MRESESDVMTNYTIEPSSYVLSKFFRKSYSII